MDAMRPIFLASGRIPPRPFAITILLLYVVAFLSQILLAAPVTARLGFWPFTVLQAALIWLWFALHASRLRDSGRGIGPAIGIACLYALAVILLMLLVGALDTPAMHRPGSGRAAHASVVQLFVVLDMITRILGNPDPAGFGFILLVFMAMILIPILVAIGFSIATSRHASVPAS